MGSQKSERMEKPSSKNNWHWFIYKKIHAKGVSIETCLFWLLGDSYYVGGEWPVVRAVDKGDVVLVETERAAHHSVEAEDVAGKLEQVWKNPEMVQFEITAPLMLFLSLQQKNFFFPQ